MHGSDGGTWHPALAWRASRASAEASGARNRALRILHVTPYYHDAWAYGGIPRVVSALARAQARLGHAVTVCTTDAGTERRLERPGGQRPRLRPWSALGADGLRIHVFPNVSNRLAYNQLFLPMGLSAFLRRHAGRSMWRTCTRVATFRASLPRTRCGARACPMCSRRTARRRESSGGLGPSACSIWWHGRRVLESARRVLAVTEIERRQLETLGVPARRLRVIGNPIDLDEFQVARAGDAFRERAGVGTAPLILFLGKLTPRKRVDVVVRAFAALDAAGARLVLAGNDMGAGASILRLVDECKLRERVRFTGLLAGRDRLDALAAADVVVYPSADESSASCRSRRSSAAALSSSATTRAAPKSCETWKAPARCRSATRMRSGRPSARGSRARRGDRLRWRAAHASRRGPAAGGLLSSWMRCTARSSGPLSPGGQMPERVSLVMPVRNGAPWLSRALSALLEQFPGAEVIVVDDGSADESLAIVNLFAASHDVRVLHGARRGAAAALNLGLAAASCDLVVQVDQDVEILPGWADAVLAGFDAPDVAAVQACYVPDPCAPAIARVMALDLALRYARLAGATNHVCTGNTAYRRAALAAVGPSTSAWDTGTTTISATASWPRAGPSGLRRRDGACTTGVTASGTTLGSGWLRLRPARSRGQAPSPDRGRHCVAGADDGAPAGLRRGVHCARSRCSGLRGGRSLITARPYRGITRGAARGGAVACRDWGCAPAARLGGAAVSDRPPRARWCVGCGDCRVADAAGVPRAAPAGARMRPRPVIQGDQRSN